MILVLLVVVLVAVAVSAVLGMGRSALGDGDDAPEPRRRLPFWALAAVPIGLLVGFVMLGAVLGLRATTDTSSSTTAPSAPAGTTQNVRTTALRTETTSPALGPIVQIDEGVNAVGELERDTVLRVRVTGFPSFASAQVKQCADDACGNHMTVQFREDGTASFQYLIVDDFAPTARGACRVDATPCSIVVESVDGDGRADVATVFEDPLPAAGRLEVEPIAELVEGDEVSVRLEGFRPGTDVEVVLCAAPATTGTERCGEPGPVVPVTVAEDGSAETSLVARISEVGTERVTCGRGSGCAVAVRSSSAFVRAPHVPLQFAARPGADYDPTRVLVGLAIALALLLTAGFLIRRTDWSAIGEEAAPEIDDAEYADLDAIIALLPPEEVEEDLPVPTGRRRD